jgi:hypothetical protein
VREAPTATNVLGRGVVAGVAGTVVMTAFQKFVEMPITGREDSYAPAELRRSSGSLPRRRRHDGA